MIVLLTEFVLRCRKAGIVPNEKHIEAFLNSHNKIKYRETFIKLCFYHWNELIE